MSFPNISMTGSALSGTLVQRDVEFFDDFLVGSVEAGGKFSRTADFGDWLITDDVDMTAVIADDEPGGVLRLTTGSNSGDFGSCQLNGEGWKVAKNKDIYFEIRLKLDDTNDTRWFVGLAATDITGTTFGPILDGVIESIGFRQTSATAVDIIAISEDGSTETTSDTGINVSDDVFVKLAFHVYGNSRVKYYVNGVQKAEHVQNIPTGDALTLTMEVQGPTASSILEVDYIYCAQVR